MALPVIWAKRARSDLRLTVDHLRQDSPEAARTFGRAMVQAAASLSTLSMRGRVVPELGNPDVRELLLGRYRLVYEVFPTQVAVVRIIHASRDFMRAWRSPGSV